MLFRKVLLFYVVIEKDTFNTNGACTHKIHPCFNGLNYELQVSIKKLINDAVILIYTNYHEPLFSDIKADKLNKNKLNLVYVKIDRKMFAIEKEGSCMFNIHPCFNKLDKDIQEQVKTLFNEAIDLIRNNINPKDL